jgi:hypothetical protein
MTLDNLKGSKPGIVGSGDALEKGDCVNSSHDEIPFSYETPNPGRACIT